MDIGWKRKGCRLLLLFSPGRGGELFDQCPTKHVSLFNDQPTENLFCFRSQFFGLFNQAQSKIGIVLKGSFDENATPVNYDVSKVIFYMTVSLIKLHLRGIVDKSTSRPPENFNTCSAIYDIRASVCSSSGDKRDSSLPGILSLTPTKVCTSLHEMIQKLKLPLYHLTPVSVSKNVGSVILTKPCYTKIKLLSRSNCFSITSLSVLLP